jgi:hypothetical protein
MSFSHMFVVLTAPTEGMVDEFNAWYDEVHLADVLKLKDFVAAQRFRFVPQREGDEPLRPYLALYETQTDDVLATQRALVEVAGTEKMPYSPAIDMTKAIGWYYEALGERVTDGTTAFPLDHEHVFVVHTTPTAGMEDEFNAWYDEVHIPDVLKLPAYAAARRYRHVPLRPDAEVFRPYLALYETTTTDVPATQRALMDVVATDAMPFSPAIDRTQSVGWYYEAIGERRTS